MQGDDEACPASTDQDRVFAEFTRERREKLDCVFVGSVGFLLKKPLGSNESECWWE